MLSVVGRLASRGAAAPGTGRLVAFEPQGLQLTVTHQHDAVRQHLLQAHLARQAGTHAIEFFRLALGNQDGGAARRVGIGEHALEGPAQLGVRGVDFQRLLVSTAQRRQQGQLAKSGIGRGVVVGIGCQGKGAGSRQYALRRYHGPDQVPQNPGAQQNQQGGDDSDSRFQ